MVCFAFQGTVLTDAEDRKTIGSDLQIELESETCPWLTAEAVTWLKETVEQAVRIEFDRYIAAGDLQRTIDRLQRLEVERRRRADILAWACERFMAAPRPALGESIGMFHAPYVRLCLARSGGI